MFDFDDISNRPTRALVHTDRLRHNYQIIKNKIGPNVKIMGVVKANAYGHGLLRISKELVQLGAHYLGVAFLEEALYLRKLGFKIPILVLGAINIEQIPLFIKNRIEITASSIEKAQAISMEAEKLSQDALVHLKIDTGMNRIGVRWQRGMDFIKFVLGLPNIELKGVFSHFAKSDDDVDFSRKQLKRFSGVLKQAKREGINIPLAHMANSDAIVSFPESRLDMVRPGLALYGYVSSAKEQASFEPVMTLLTKASYFKYVRKGQGISYGHSFTTKRGTRIVTLPVGYGDGYPRGLSNKAFVMIRNKKYPSAGTICMDQMMVDLGPDGTAYNGDDALLFGRYQGDEIDLKSLCASIRTIPYEILCGISSRVPRIYL